MLFTTITEGYEVSVYRSRKTLAEDLEAEGFVLLPDLALDAPATTAKDIAARLRTARQLLLYRRGTSDWTLKVQVHGKERSAKPAPVKRKRN